MLTAQRPLNDKSAGAKKRSNQQQDVQNQNDYEGSSTNNKEEVFKTKFAEYRNGIFQGQVNRKSLQRQGLGVFLWDSGEAYFGEWMSDLLEGEGMMFFPNGGFIHGFFFKNQISGPAFFKFPNGNIYEGFWRQGKLEGNCYKYFSEENSWILCEFRGGIFQRVLSKGQGLPPSYVFNYISSAEEICQRHKKQQQKDKYQVRTLKFKNGAQYLGFVIKNVPNGIGILKFKSGKFNSGFYLNGVLNGLCRMGLPNGDIYDGYVREGQYEGKGVHYQRSTSSWIYGIFVRNTCISVLKQGNGLLPLDFIENQRLEHHLKSEQFIEKNTPNEAVANPKSSISKSIIVAPAQRSLSRLRKKSKKTQHRMLSSNQYPSTGRRFLSPNNQNQTDQHFNRFTSEEEFLSITGQQQQHNHTPSTVGNLFQSSTARSQFFGTGSGPGVGAGGQQQQLESIKDRFSEYQNKSQKILNKKYSKVSSPSLLMKEPVHFQTQSPSPYTASTPLQQMTPTKPDKHQMNKENEKNDLVAAHLARKLSSPQSLLYNFFNDTVRHQQQHQQQQLQPSGDKKQENIKNQSNNSRSPSPSTSMGNQYRKQSPAKHLPRSTPPKSGRTQTPLTQYPSINLDKESSSGYTSDQQQQQPQPQNQQMQQQNTFSQQPQQPPQRNFDQGQFNSMFQQQQPGQQVLEDLKDQAVASYNTQPPSAGQTFAAAKMFMNKPPQLQEQQESLSNQNTFNNLSSDFNSPSSIVKKIQTPQSNMNQQSTQYGQSQFLSTNDGGPDNSNLMGNINQIPSSSNILPSPQQKLQQTLLNNKQGFQYPSKPLRQSQQQQQLPQSEYLQKSLSTQLGPATNQQQYLQKQRQQQQQQQQYSPLNIAQDPTALVQNDNILSSDTSPMDNPDNNAFQQQQMQPQQEVNQQTGQAFNEEDQGRNDFTSADNYQNNKELKTQQYQFHNQQISPEQQQQSEQFFSKPQVQLNQLQHLQQQQLDNEITQPIQQQQQQGRKQQQIEVLAKTGQFQQQPIRAQQNHQQTPQQQYEGSSQQIEINMDLDLQQQECYQQAQEVRNQIESSENEQSAARGLEGPSATADEGEGQIQQLQEILQFSPNQEAQKIQQVQQQKQLEKQQRKQQQSPQGTNNNNQSSSDVGEKSSPYLPMSSQQNMRNPNPATQSYGQDIIYPIAKTHQQMQQMQVPSVIVDPDSVDQQNNSEFFNQQLQFNQALKNQFELQQQLLLGQQLQQQQPGQILQQPERESELNSDQYRFLQETSQQQNQNKRQSESPTFSMRLNEASPTEQEIQNLFDDSSIAGSQQHQKLNTLLLKSPQQILDDQQQQPLHSEPQQNNPSQQIQQDFQADFKERQKWVKPLSQEPIKNSQEKLSQGLANQSQPQIIAQTAPFLKGQEVHQQDYNQMTVQDPNAAAMTAPKNLLQRQQSAQNKYQQNQVPLNNVKEPVFTFMSSDNSSDFNRCSKSPARRSLNTEEEKPTYEKSTDNCNKSQQLPIHKHQQQQQSTHYYQTEPAAMDQQQHGYSGCDDEQQPTQPQQFNLYSQEDIQQQQQQYPYTEQLLPPKQPTEDHQFVDERQEDSQSQILPERDQERRKRSKRQICEQILNEDTPLEEKLALIQQMGLDEALASQLYNMVQAMSDSGPEERQNLMQNFVQFVDTQDINQQGEFENEEEKVKAGSEPQPLPEQYPQIATKSDDQGEEINLDIQIGDQGSEQAKFGLCKQICEEEGEDSSSKVNLQDAQVILEQHPQLLESLSNQDQGQGQGQRKTATPQKPFNKGQFIKQQVLNQLQQRQPQQQIEQQLQQQQQQQQQLPQECSSSSKSASNRQKPLVQPLTLPQQEKTQSSLELRNLQQYNQTSLGDPNSSSLPPDEEMLANLQLTEEGNQINQQGVCSGSGGGGGEDQEQRDSDYSYHYQNKQQPQQNQQPDANIVQSMTNKQNDGTKQTGMDNQKKQNLQNLVKQIDTPQQQLLLQQQQQLIQALPNSEATAIQSQQSYKAQTVYVAQQQQQPQRATTPEKLSQTQTPIYQQPQLFQQIQMQQNANKQPIELDKDQSHQQFVNNEAQLNLPSSSQNRQPPNMIQTMNNEQDMQGMPSFQQSQLQQNFYYSPSNSNTQTGPGPKKVDLIISGYKQQQQTSSQLVSGSGEAQSLLQQQSSLKESNSTKQQNKPTNISQLIQQVQPIQQQNVMPLQYQQKPIINQTGQPYQQQLPQPPQQQQIPGNITTEQLNKQQQQQDIEIQLQLSKKKIASLQESIEQQKIQYKQQQTQVQQVTPFMDQQGGTGLPQSSGSSEQLATDQKQQYYQLLQQLPTQLQQQLPTYQQQQSKSSPNSRKGSNISKNDAGITKSYTPDSSPMKKKSEGGGIDQSEVPVVEQVQKMQKSIEKINEKAKFEQQLVESYQTAPQLEAQQKARRQLNEKLSIQQQQQQLLQSQTQPQQFQQPQQQQQQPSSQAINQQQPKQLLQQLQPLYVAGEVAKSSETTPKSTSTKFANLPTTLDQILKLSRSISQKKIQSQQQISDQGDIPASQTVSPLQEAARLNKSISQKKLTPQKQEQQQQQQMQLPLQSQQQQLQLQQQFFSPETQQPWQNQEDPQLQQLAASSDVPAPSLSKKSSTSILKSRDSSPYSQRQQQQHQQQQQAAFFSKQQSPLQQQQQQQHSQQSNLQQDQIQPANQEEADQEFNLDLDMMGDQGQQYSQGVYKSGMEEASGSDIGSTKKLPQQVPQQLQQQQQQQIPVVASLNKTKKKVTISPPKTPPKVGQNSSDSDDKLPPSQSARPVPGEEFSIPKQVVQQNNNDLQQQYLSPKQSIKEQGTTLQSQEKKVPQNFVGDFGQPKPSGNAGQPNQIYLLIQKEIQDQLNQMKSQIYNSIEENNSSSKKASSPTNQQQYYSAPQANATSQFNPQVQDQAQKKPQQKQLTIADSPENLPEDEKLKKKQYDFSQPHYLQQFQTLPSPYAQLIQKNPIAASQGFGASQTSSSPSPIVHKRVADEAPEDQEYLQFLQQYQQKNKKEPSSLEKRLFKKKQLKVPQLDLPAAIAKAKTLETIITSSDSEINPTSPRYTCKSDMGHQKSPNGSGRRTLFTKQSIQNLLNAKFKPGPSSAAANGSNKDDGIQTQQKQSLATANNSNSNSRSQLKDLEMQIKQASNANTLFKKKKKPSEYEQLQQQHQQKPMLDDEHIMSSYSPSRNGSPKQHPLLEGDELKDKLLINKNKNGQKQTQTQTRSPNLSYERFNIYRQDPSPLKSGRVVLTTSSPIKSGRAVFTTISPLKSGRAILTTASPLKSGRAATSLIGNIRIEDQQQVFHTYSPARIIKTSSSTVSPAKRSYIGATTIITPTGIASHRPIIPKLLLPGKVITTPIALQVNGQPIYATHNNSIVPSPRITQQKIVYSPQKSIVQSRVYQSPIKQTITYSPTRKIFKSPISTQRHSVISPTKSISPMPVRIQQQQQYQVNLGQQIIVSPGKMRNISSPDKPIIQINNQQFPQQTIVNRSPYLNKVVYISPSKQSGGVQPTNIAYSINRASPLIAPASKQTTITRVSSFSPQPNNQQPFMMAPRQMKESEKKILIPKTYLNQPQTQRTHSSQLKDSRSQTSSLSERIDTVSSQASHGVTDDKDNQQCKIF